MVAAAGREPALLWASRGRLGHPGRIRRAGRAGPLGGLHIPTRLSLLGQTAGRPWPLPTRPWVMRQTWRELLFAHWPLPPWSLQPFLPPGLTLDTYEGQAWVGVVPFRMTDIRFR